MRLPFLGRLSNSSLTRLYTLIGLSLLLTACNHDTPIDSWEVAVKGSYSAALAQDGKQAVIGSITHGGSLWQINKSAGRQFTWNHDPGSKETSNIIAAAFSPEGNFAFTADHLTMVLWNTRNGQALTYWTAPAEVLSVALTPNGKFALLGLDNHQVVLYDAKRGGIKRRFNHDNRVRSVDLSQDGKQALSGAEDYSAVLWDVQTAKPLQRWQHKEEVQLVKLSPDGSKALTVSKYDRAMLWNTASGEAIGEIPMSKFALARGRTFNSASFSADGSLLLTGTSDRIVQLWQVSNQQQLASWLLPKRSPWKPTGASVEAVAFENKNSFIAVASNGYIHRLKR